jgi:hypothetical protein
MRTGLLTAVCLLACAGPTQTAREGEPAPADSAHVSPTLDERPDCPPVPGTRVCIDVPPGHEPGQGFDGYQWPATGSSLFMIEFPGPQSEIAKAFAVPGPIAEGMTVLHTQSLQACGGAGQLAQVSQPVSGTLYHKWILICGDENATLILNAVYPASDEETLSAPFRAAVLSASWDRSLVLDPFAKVDWSIDAPPELQFAHETGGMFAYTQDGVATQGGMGPPMFLVAPSMGTVVIADLRATAEARFHQLSEIQSIEIATSRASKIAGFDAWEIVGQARDTKSDRQLSVYLMMLVRADSYILVVGMVDANAAEPWLERFRAAASSWKLKND